MSLDLQKETTIYANLMTEIKERTRIAVVKIGLIRRAPDLGLNSIIEAECVILQIRVVCELIALASLAAHSKAGLSNDLMKSWNAERSIKELARLNSDSFPTPIAIVPREPDGYTVSPRKVEINKEKLCSIYAECGKKLHRGKVRDILSGIHPNHELGVLEKWLVQISDLLSLHYIQFRIHETQLIVSMFTEPDGRVSVAKSVGPGFAPNFSDVHDGV